MTDTKHKENSEAQADIKKRAELFATLTLLTASVAYLRFSHAAFREWEMQAELDKLREALAQQAEQGWQPIETAPKDGTVILLFRNKEVLAGAFHPELGKYPWLIIEESKDGTNGLQEGVHGPTHWMPLPEAPKGGV